MTSICVFMSRTLDRITVRLKVCWRFERISVHIVAEETRDEKIGGAVSAAEKLIFLVNGRPYFLSYTGVLTLVICSKVYVFISPLLYRSSRKHCIIKIILYTSTMQLSIDNGCQTSSFPEISFSVTDSYRAVLSQTRARGSTPPFHSKETQKARTRPLFHDFGTCPRNFSLPVTRRWACTVFPRTRSDLRVNEDRFYTGRRIFA